MWPLVQQVLNYKSLKIRNISSMNVYGQINHIFQLGGWLKFWVNPYASTESQKILFPQQYLQRNKTNMTLFQVALPSILDYLLELKRSGPLLSFLRLHLLSLSAWNSQVDFLSANSPHPDPCNVFSGWGRVPPVNQPSGLLACYSQCPPTLFVIFTELSSCLYNLVQNERSRVFWWTVNF